MTLTVEDWTAIKSILRNASVDDWSKLKYDVKIGLLRAQKKEEFREAKCDGVCGNKEYVRFLTPVKFGDKFFYLCDGCYETYEELNSDFGGRFGC